VAWMGHGMWAWACSSSPEAVGKVARRYLDTRISVDACMQQARYDRYMYAAMRISHCLAWSGLKVEGHSLV
jgi:hypothetical protein